VYGLVIIDTLARCMAGGDENSARDMGRLIQSADMIRDLTSAAVLLVHHTNKSGESERGSTALRGAVDTLLSLKKSESGIITLTCEKQKDGAPFQPIEMVFEERLESVILRSRGAMAPGADELTPGELDTLRHLALTALADGLSTTAWHDVTQKARRTFYNHRKRLYEGGYVVGIGSRGTTKYVVSNKGNDALGERCHGTAMARALS